MECQSTFKSPKKEDNLGVGCNKIDPEACWVNSAREYGEVLQTLQAAFSAKTQELALKNEKKERKRKKKEEKRAQKSSEKEKEPKKKHSKTPIIPSEEKVVKTHAHFIPTKVVSGKKVSSYSKQDLDAILGLSAQPESPAPSKFQSKKEEEINAKTSTVSIHDYFNQQKTNKRTRTISSDGPVPKKQKVS